MEPKKIIMTIALAITVVFTPADERKIWQLNHVESVNVDSSYLNLTDTCEVVMPRNMITKSGRAISELVRIGDGLKVFVYANDAKIQEFEGYVATVNADDMLVIKAEDEMWKLKKLKVNVSLKNTTLPELLGKIVPGYQINALPVELGSAYYANSTVAQVLDDLKSNFNLYSFCRGKVLHVGTIHQGDESADLAFNKNILNGNLTIRRKGENPIKVKAVSVLKGGDKLEVEVGEDGGETHELTYYNITSKAELQKLAERDLEQLDYDGMKGDVDALGNVFVQHGYVVHLTDPEHDEKNGSYYAERVKMKYTRSDGYIKTITLGKRA